MKVEMYPQGGRLDCSISRAGGRVKWTIHLYREDIFHPSHEFKTVNICFISLLHKFQNVINIFNINFKMTFTCLPQEIPFWRATLWFEALTYND